MQGIGNRKTVRPIPSKGMLRKGHTYSPIQFGRIYNKWTMATELRNRRKGKVKTNVIYRGKNHEAYLSHVKVQITAFRKDICLILVYGITEHSMMLATNKKIRSKEDVVKVARIYFYAGKSKDIFVVKSRCSGWKISA